MSKAGTPIVMLPPDAVFGRLDPECQGPFAAADFEVWDIDEEHPVELIGGWVLPMSPGTHRTGKTWGDLYAILLPLVKARGWDMSPDARHTLPRPHETVVFPDIAVHAAAKVEYQPGTESIHRVPDLVVEVLSRKTFERDMAPSGAKFLAYQMSGVREYYYTWPDGSAAAGFELVDGLYRPLPADADGFLASPLLGQSLRLVPPALRPA